MSIFQLGRNGILLIAGLLTCTMISAAIAPAAALRSMYGEDIALTPLMEIIVRNWGALITLMGLLLVVAAFYPPVRTTAMVIAGISKVVFIGLTLWLGKAYLSQQVGVAIIIDSIMIGLFVVCLLFVRDTPRAPDIAS
jgi:hypothetical protein